MEAFSTKDLYIWHAFISNFVRFLGFLNNINVVDHSPFMVNYLHEIAPHVKFHPLHALPPSKWHIYELGYFLECYLLTTM
jgi:hypothetical protein